MAARQSRGIEETRRIRLWGIVQGVGFRPYVAKTAAELHMRGQVLNMGGLVEITVTDTAERISAFLHTLKKNKPAPAEIVHIKDEAAPYRHFDSFTIIKSCEGDDEAVMIPSDLAICPDCLSELYDSENPRYRHPFISCMVCGPRYTIMDKIPYDRENTTMADFPMCDFCEKEYTSLEDRRHHAQTISCHECGPRLLWKSTPDSPVKADDPSVNTLLKTDAAILDRAAEILKCGGVLLFKSVGGYNLVADPLNPTAVAKLRQIKQREAKPFAVMFRTIDQIKKFCHVDPVEEKLLESSARPILLLEHKLKETRQFDNALFFDNTRLDNSRHPDHKTQYAKDFSELQKSRFIGSFLPSLAAQYLLLDRISPLIFTSANLSDMPMIKDDPHAMDLLASKPEIDAMVYNHRRILVRADDSVVRVIDGQPQMIRRSKGYAPVPLYIDTSTDTKKINGITPSIFAAGGQLKNSFALTKESFVYMSQFFGDMDTLENQHIYEDNFRRLQSFFRIKPSAVVCDLHPLYFTTRFSEAYAESNGLPLIKIQHHHAHVASVMAENHLKGKVIGISFDGTGYGTDGNIWGGEFFLCEGGKAKRIAHLRYVDMIGGDSSVKDGVRSALSYLHANDNMLTDSSDPLTIDLSDIMNYGRERLLSHPSAKLVMPALKAGINTVKSSSMGRLFDAVSSLLGICDYNHYEGQCAILLEDAAAFAQNHPGQKENFDLALAFHQRIIDMIVEQCLKARKKYNADQVALTGGTFQNKILMEGVLQKLRDNGFSPYYNISVSPNDGGIALGQAYVAMHLL